MFKLRSLGDGLAGLPEALVGLAISVSLVFALDFSAPLGGAVWAEESLSYLVVFLPLAGALAFATLARGRHSLRADFGFAATWTDLALGFAVGLALRVCGMWLEVAIYGVSLGFASSPVPHSDVVAWLVLAVMAPIIVAPVIEELFFRGLLLRGLLAMGSRFSLSSRGASLLAIGGSSLTFALVHLIGVRSPSQAVLVGVMAFLLSGIAAMLTLRTGRLGAGIALHITYNAMILIPGLLA